MGKNGVFPVCYYSIYLRYALTLYIYRYKKKVKKVCKIFGTLKNNA